MTDESLELLRCTFEEINQDSQNSPLSLTVITTGQLSFKSGGEKHPGSVQFREAERRVKEKHEFCLVLQNVKLNI